MLKIAAVLTLSFVGLMNSSTNALSIGTQDDMKKILQNEMASLNDTQQNKVFEQVQSLSAKIMTDPKLLERFESVKEGIQDEIEDLDSKDMNLDNLLNEIGQNSTMETQILSLFMDLENPQ